MTLNKKQVDDEINQIVDQIIDSDNIILYNIFVLIAFLLSVLIIYCIVNYFTKTLGKLIEVSEQVVKGDFEGIQQKLGKIKETNDETGALVKHFKTLSNNLMSRDLNFNMLAYQEKIYNYNKFYNEEGVYKARDLPWEASLPLLRNRNDNQEGESQDVQEIELNQEQNEIVNNKSKTD